MSRVIYFNASSTTEPAVVGLFFGDAAWSPGNEVYFGILRNFQIYDTNLSLSNIANEINSPGSVQTPWYLNRNPTPSNISDNSGNNNDPSWVGGERPTLWASNTDFLIPKDSGNPFYTNISNPFTTSSLSAGQSEIVTFWVNATGDVSTNRSLLAFANTTSDQSISNITGIMNVTISAAAADSTPPQWSNNQTNSTLAGSTVNHSVFWTDNLDLNVSVFSLDNGNGSFLNFTTQAIDSTNWTNFSYVVNSTVGSTIQWRVYANDTTDNLNVTSDFQYDTTTDNFPQWFDNSTNSTSAGALVKHNVRWTDDNALSGYIFSFDNGNGTLNNDSFVEMSGAANWSNVSKIVNSTIGSTIRWQVYTNDSFGNLNTTSIFQYTTTETQAPNISFVAPTRADGNTTSDVFIEMNVTINESSLDEVKWNWNGTNFTLYNDSLILMYNFDNVSALGENDTHVVDLSGYGNNGTVTGGNVTTAGGKYERAMQFDSTNDIVNAQSNAILDDITTKTICSWIKPTAFDYRDIVSKMVDNSIGWIFRLAQNCPSGDRLCYYHKFDGAAGYWSTAGQITLNEWNHVCVAFDASSSSNDPSLYIDGNSQNVAESITPSGSSSSDATANLIIGNLRTNLDDPSFGGLIDDVRIWNRTLTTAEINQSYMSNLRKYDSDKWLLYVNQSKTPDVGLDLGVYTYQAFAKDTTGNLNQTEERNITIQAADATAPQWQDNQTNSTLAGSTVNHSVFWTDNLDLNVSVFSLDNGNGSFLNFTTQAIDSTNWTNFSYVVNSTVGSTIQWRVYANDSSGNLNVTSDFQYTTTGVDSCTCIDGASWTIIDGDQCVLSTTCNLGANPLRIMNGALKITSSGQLNAQGCYVQDTESLYVIEGGKLICR